jgi:hypothetical protein
MLVASYVGQPALDAIAQPPSDSGE